MKKYYFRQFDNWHAHPRQDELLAVVYKYFNIYGRVLCMGNTDPLIETADDAFMYRKKILSHDVSFEPVMCIMLTNDTTPEMIYEAARRGIKFVKFIPVGTSQGAVKGLRIDDFKELYRIFSAVEECGMHLLIHAEFISFRGGEEIHFLKREELALQIIAVYRFRFPLMKITIEHASTRKMIEFIKEGNKDYLRATLTPQHALLTYFDVFDSDDKMINPFNYCLPVVKTEDDRQAVREAMTSGDPRFFAGTDAAPHWKWKKESDNPPPGIFFGASEFLQYFKVFEAMGELERFEDFTSRFGAEYYAFPLNVKQITIVEEERTSPVEEDGIRFCLGGEKMNFQIIESGIKYKKK